MTQYHAVMIDETGCEFGVTFDAKDRPSAYDYLEEQYPESRVDELKTSDEWDEERAERERRISDSYWSDDYDADYDD